MNNESIKLNIIDGIYDIHPLLSPAMSNLEIVILALLIILTTSIIFYNIWKAFYSSKGQARRKLKKLHTEHSQNNINNHDTVYKLCSILRDGLKLNKISKDTRLPTRLKTHQSEWETFNKKISNLRYNNNEKSHTDIDTVFSDSLYWLKLWS